MKTITRTILVFCIAYGLFLCLPSLCAAWIPDGSPVCTAPDNQDHPELASDGVGGAYYTWIDVRGGEFDIYCQRVDANGTALWTADGIDICTTGDTQTLPQILADGAGGAFITWQSIHDYERDIYAQRVDANGTVLWTVDGIVICDAAGHQGWHALVRDGAGGLIIAWEDQRNDHNDIYAQRVDADGNILWAENGVVIAAAESAQQSPRMVTDGQGGAIVVWSDARFIVVDVYAQRFDGDGNTLWTSGGVAICIAEEEQRQPRITTDGASGAIITWHDQRGLGDVYIYAQRVASDGDVLWATNGVAIAPANNDQQYAEIVSDDAGGAIIGWNQGFPGANTIYAQRVNASGTSLWTDSGVEVGGATGNLDHPRIITDGAGGAVIAWEDFQEGTWSDIYAQRLDGTGVNLWSTDGVAVCTALWDQTRIQMTNGSDGNVIITWDDARPGSHLDIYTSLVDANGTLVPNFLQSYEAQFEAGAIAVHWRISHTDPGVDFTIWRQEIGDETAWDRIAARIDRVDDTYSFSDGNLLPGVSYRYRIDISKDGTSRLLFETTTVQVPESVTRLLPNVPNPFNPQTTVSFALDRRQQVSLSVYDLTGRCLVQLTDAVFPAGIHRLEWNGQDAEGREVGSGTYLLRLRTANRLESRKIALVR